MGGSCGLRADRRRRLRGRRCLTAAVGLLLSFLTFLLAPAAPGLAESGPAPVGALILYDTAPPYPWLGELHAEQLANLLGHFPFPWTMEPVENYSAGEIEDYAVTFYLGVGFDNPLPEAFLSDVMATERTICWFEYNLWQIAWNELGYWDPAFGSRFGFQFAGVDDSGYPEIFYKGQFLSKDLRDPDIGACAILDPEVAEAAAFAYRPETETEPEAWWPYAVRGRNLWYFADSPFSYVSETDRYLVFCDLIHDVVGIDHAPDHRALIRIEDVDPTAEPRELKSLADYLSREHAPFSVATVPVFKDPFGVMGTPQTVFLSQKRHVIDALEYMESRGGSIFAHGYTHQYDSTLNPYNGLTGDDCEFFRSIWNDETNTTEFVGPLPEDSVEWVNGRIDQSLAELAAAGFTPVAWETPHYLASKLDSIEFGKRFSSVSGRVLYFTSDETYCLGQFYPYPIERDIYGQRVLPENLGNVELEPFYDYPAWLPEDIVGAAEKNLVVRDGWASAYFHPYLDVSHLDDIVTGVKDLGYTYTPPPTVVAEAGPDATIIDGESTTLQGSASHGMGPYHYSWSPAESLKHPTAADPAASPHVSTLYTLTVTDADGRIGHDTAAVVVIPLLEAEAGPDRTIIPGRPAVLEGLASGGVSPYSCSWTPTEGLDDPSAAQPTASPGATTTYKLTVADSGTQIANDTVTVTMLPHTLSVTATVTPDAVSSGGSAALSATAGDSWEHGVASWSWSDGGAGGSFAPSAEAQNPTYTASANATDYGRQIALTVTAICDGPEPQTANDSATLTVRPVEHALTVTASADPETVPSGGSASLSAVAVDSRSGHEVAWSWSDGGAGGSFAPSAEAQNPTYTALANATDDDRQITLTVTATCNGPEPLSADDSVTLTVQPVAHELTVTASLDPTTVASGSSATLSATAVDSRTGHEIASWSWSDGGAGGSFTPSAEVPSPTYAAPPNTADEDRQITLTVTAVCDGPEPESASDSAALTVQPVEHVLTATASADPLTVVSGGSTSLSATAVDSRTEHEVTWSWSDAGGGGSFSPSAETRNPTYTAPENRTDADLTIALTATATCDGPVPATESDSVDITVQPVAHSVSVEIAPPSPSPVASGGVTSLSAAMTDTRTHEAAAWSWSDGGAGGTFLPSASIPAPQYTAPENVTGSAMDVVLTATATCDGPTPESASNSVVVSVLPIAPLAAFWAAPVEGSAPLVVEFADLSQMAPTSWEWDFGDGNSSPERNPTHRYASPGTYAVSLTASNAGGTSTETKNGYIVVTEPPIPPPAADFAGAPVAGEAPLAVSFSDYSAGDPMGWEWDFGDGGISLEQNPSHTYESPGTYTVTLTASNLSGSDTMVKAGYVAVSEPLPEFGDVSKGYWAYDEIMACVAAGIVGGYEDGTYRPGDEVTRDQMGVYIARALAGGEDGVPEFSGTPSFSDIDTNWALKYIEYAAVQGVVSGYGDGSYHPEYEVTRDQMAVYMARSIARPTGEAGLAGYEPSEPHNFEDVPPDSWAYKHVEFCVEKGVVEGYADGLYHPDWVVTRDQMAVYVTRAFALPVR